MAIANLHETLLNYKLRRNAINLEISQLQSQKTLATYSQADRQAIKAKDEEGVRQYFKALYEGDDDYQLQYKDYTEIPDFEEEMDKIAAKYTDELAELTAWETALDAQITTDSAVDRLAAVLRTGSRFVNGVFLLPDMSGRRNDFRYGIPAAPADLLL